MADLKLVENNTKEDEKSLTGQEVILAEVELDGFMNFTIVPISMVNPEGIAVTGYRIYCHARGYKFAVSANSLTDIPEAFTKLVEQMAGTFSA